MMNQGTPSDVYHPPQAQPQSAIPVSAVPVAQPFVGSDSYAAKADIQVGQPAL